MRWKIIERGDSFRKLGVFIFYSVCEVVVVDSGGRKGGRGLRGGEESTTEALGIYFGFESNGARCIFCLSVYQAMIFMREDCSMLFYCFVLFCFVFSK